MRDQWDEKVRPICDWLVSRCNAHSDKAFDEEVEPFADALRAAYEKGVEDSADVAGAYADDPAAAQVVRDAIRALKGQKS